MEQFALGVVALASLDVCVFCLFLLLYCSDCLKPTLMLSCNTLHKLCVTCVYSIPSRTDSDHFVYVFDTLLCNEVDISYMCI